MSSHAVPASRSGVPRGLTVLLGAAAAVVIVGGIRSFGGTLGPVFLALLLVVAVHPIQAWLTRRGVPAWLGVLATLLAAYVVLLGLAAALILSIAQLATVLPSYTPRFTELLDQAVTGLDNLGVGQDQISSALSGLDLTNLLGVLQSVLSGLVTVLSDLALIVALILFMALDAAGFPRRLAEVGALHPDLVAALTSFAHGTRRYLLVSAVFGAIVAVLDLGPLYWLGVPLPLLWALLSFITNYIPNVGFVVGLVPPALLGLLDGGVRVMGLVIIAYSVINTMVQSLIQPKFVGDAVGLNSTLSFLSLFFWGFVLGPLGALLAIPLSLLTKALLVDADPTAAWLNPLITGRPQSSPAATADPTPVLPDPPPPGADRVAR